MKRKIMILISVRGIQFYLQYTYYGVRDLILTKQFPLYTYLLNTNRISFDHKPLHKLKPHRPQNAYDLRILCLSTYSEPFANQQVLRIYKQRAWPIVCLSSSYDFPIPLSTPTKPPTSYIPIIIECSWICQESKYTYSSHAVSHSPRVQYGVSGAVRQCSPANGFVYYIDASPFP